MIITKICNKCYEEKHVSEFYEREGSLDGYRADCKKCNNKTGKIRYQNNKVMIVAKQKEYYIKNKLEIKNKSSEYYENNKEAVKNRVKFWKQNNKEKVKISNQNRRARRYHADGKITRKVVDKLIVEQNGLCYYCFVDILDEFDLEHKTPLIRGGTNFINNLCISCKTCNMEKHTMTEQEYLEYKRKILT